VNFTHLRMGRYLECVLLPQSASTVILLQKLCVDGMGIVHVEPDAKQRRVTYPR
jgi:hypothetical protein